MRIDYYPYVLQVLITAEFLYFGLRFCFLNADIAVVKPIPSSFTFNELENLVQSQSQSSLKKFTDEIKADIWCLNQTQLGGKTGWQSNGLFPTLPAMCMCIATRNMQHVQPYCFLSWRDRVGASQQKRNG